MLPFDPKKPLYGFTARFPHAKRRVQFFINEPEEHVYFRPQHAPKDWWGVLGDTFFEFCAQDLKSKNISAFEFTREAKRFMQREVFFRQFFLPDPREGEKRMWNIHWRPDVGRIYPVQKSGAWGRSYFRPRDNKPCNLIRASTQYISAQFLHEWYDPTSDAREALHFCDLTHDERARHVLKWEEGGIEQLEHLIHIACVCDSTLWESSSAGFIRINPTEDCPLYVHPIFYDRGQIRAMLSPRLHRVLQRICDCSPSFVQKGKNNRNFGNWPWDPNLPDSMLAPQNIDIIIEPPTQHERIEASLILRDWLRENAPDLLPDWFPDAV